jgi:uncharacterized protein
VLLLDTGPIVAAANTADPDHTACARLLAAHPGPFIITGLVVSEASYLLGKYLGPTAEAALLRTLATDRFRLEPLAPTDLKRMADLVEQYAELGLGATDASLIADAERLGLVDIATIDHRHFSVVRPSHVGAFRLLPE